MDQGATWYGGRPQPRQHCVRWGPSSPYGKGHSSLPLIGPCPLWPNVRPFQQLLNSCLLLNLVTLWLHYGLPSFCDALIKSGSGYTILCLFTRLFSAFYGGIRAMNISLSFAHDGDYAFQFTNCLCCLIVCSNILQYCPRLGTVRVGLLVLNVHMVSVVVYCAHDGI